VFFFSWGSEEKKSSVTTIGTEGFFRLAKENGVWWFLTPEGNKFVSLGINHIEPILLCSDNNKELFTKKYGQDLIKPGGRPNIFSSAAKQWLEDSTNLIRKWGFNTLGVHNPIPQSKMPYVVKFRSAKIDGWAGLKRKYLDPFDPNTEIYVNQLAQKWCAKRKDDKMIFGISLNDMPKWRSSPEKIHEWVKFCMELETEMG
jgi:agarase